MRNLTAFTAATAAISLAATPLLAQSAAPLSVASAVERSGAQTSEPNALQGHALISVFVVIAVVLGAILIPEITRPNSP
jgi:hypothetical protein